MRAHEFIVENVTRRTALGALAGLATSAVAQTSTTQTPYQDLTWLEFPYERVAKEKLAGRPVSEREYWEWKLREHRLKLRIDNIVDRLASADPNRAKWKGVVEIVVSMRSPGSGGYAHDAKQLRIGLSQNWNISADSLAYLIAHEIGHVVHGHQSPDKLQNSVISRQNEIEADVYGAQLATRAGYKPQRMYDTLGRGDPESRTHPSYIDRRRSVRDRTGIPVSTAGRVEPVAESEQSKKHLVIFDVDDTLLHTTAQIAVVKDGQIVRRLSNQQFNDYVLQPGEQYDFSEFRDALKFNRESTPIGRMIEKLKFKMQNPRNHIIFLTARSDFDDKDLFLQTFKDLHIDMSRIHVHRAGNLPGDDAPAHKKAVWVRHYLDTGRYDSVSLYDDSNQNLRVFKSLDREYPGINFHAYHVGSSGRTRTVEVRLNEMPLIQQSNLGDQLEGPFNPRNLRLINSPAARERTTQYFRKTPFNFRIFFCHYPSDEEIWDSQKQRKFSRAGIMPLSGQLSYEKIRDFFDKNNDAQEILSGVEGAITFIIWRNRRTERRTDSSILPMTPHIIAHYFGHATTQREQMRQTANALRYAVENIYGIKIGWSPASTILANAIGTTKAGRNQQLTVHQELAHEAVAQYINIGAVALNPLPETLNYDGKTYHANIDAAQRQTWSSELAQTMTVQLDKFFSSIVGTVWITNE